MTFLLVGEKGRVVHEIQEFMIQPDDLVPDPRVESSDEIGYLAKFSGAFKDWPTAIYKDGVEYLFIGQEALTMEYSGEYSGCARYRKSASDEPLFLMEHSVFQTVKDVFPASKAPHWLTSKETIPGSTMDQRWFWERHVLTLKIGQHTHTDFRRITRLR